MPDTTQHTTVSLLAQRKKTLIAQGASYRLGITDSKTAVRENLHPDVLARNAISHLGATASAAFDNIFRLKNFNAGNLKILLPLITGGFSLLSKRGLVRPLLRGTVMLAVAGTIGYFVFKKKAPRREPASSDTPVN